MAYQLYNFLPTEIVWKIYDDLHKSYMKDLNKELLQHANYIKRNYEDNFPLASNIKFNKTCDDAFIRYEISGSETIEYALTQNEQYELHERLEEEFDDSFFNQHSQFWVNEEYRIYRDYDDFRLNTRYDFGQEEQEEEEENELEDNGDEARHFRIVDSDEDYSELDFIE